MPQTVGMESKCYPFQRDLVLPFVPKSRSARVIGVELEDRGSSQPDQALGCLTQIPQSEDSVTEVHIETAFQTPMTAASTHSAHCTPSGITPFLSNPLR